MDILRPAFINSNKYTTEYQERCSYEHRIRLSSNIMRKYPTRVPIIVEVYEDKYRYGKSQKFKLSKTKYLAPQDTTVHKFLNELRKHVTGLEPYESIFMYVVTPNRLHIPVLSSTILELYNAHKQNDQFLYLFLTEEQTFG